MINPMVIFNGYKFWLHIVIIHLQKLNKYLMVFYLVLKFQMKKQHMPY